MKEGQGYFEAIGPTFVQKRTYLRNDSDEHFYAVLVFHHPSRIAFSEQRARDEVNYDWDDDFSNGN